MARERREPRPSRRHVDNHGDTDHNGPVGQALRHSVHVGVALFHPSDAVDGQIGRWLELRTRSGSSGRVGPRLRGVQEEGGVGGTSREEPPELVAGKGDRLRVQLEKRRK